MNEPALTLRAYARSRRARGLPGGTLKAVQQALQAGRIALGPRGRIDPAGADAAWAARTDAAKHAAGGNGNGHQPGGAVSLVDARIREALARAHALELANAVREGQLLERGPAERAWSEHIVMARDGMLAVPAKLRHRLPHLTQGDLAVIDEEIRDALRRLADPTREETDTHGGHNGPGSIPGGREGVQTATTDGRRPRAGGPARPTPPGDGADPPRRRPRARADGRGDGRPTSPRAGEGPGGREASMRAEAPRS